MAEERVSTRETELHGASIRYHAGGAGDAVLLIHGGWGGARMHWSRVWESLAQRFFVIAPDLPGLGQLDQPALGSIAEYASWLVALLDHVGAKRAICVGNSLGGSVAWSFAGRYPERCAQLVLVAGLPMPRTPLPLLWFGRTRVGVALMQSILRRLSYHPAALSRAFAEVANAPPELREMLEKRGGELLPRFSQLVVAGDGPPAPHQAPLLLWGEEDHLPGTAPNNAHKLHRALPNSRLDLIAGAGHFPQIEQPQEFVKRLEAFLVEVA